jgi:hypothetical protein
LTQQAFFDKTHGSCSILEKLVSGRGETPTFDDVIFCA